MTAQSAHHILQRLISQVQGARFTDLGDPILYLTFEVNFHIHASTELLGFKNDYLSIRSSNFCKWKLGIQYIPNSYMKCAKKQLGV